MSDIDDLGKKYGTKNSKVKNIKELTTALEKTPVVKATKQAVAGFKSQWSGLDDKGKVGMGKGTPGIYYNTIAIPALAGMVDEKYAPDFAVKADKKAGEIKEAVRKDMGIDEPKGALEHFAYAGGEMLGQLPVPGALMNKILGGAKKMGMAGKIAAAPIEYLSPTVDPRAINYGIGTTFGGTMGAAGEALSDDPVKKALGGLIQKYDTGGKVGKVATFFSAVDKAINTLKQKKGTGEQILKQLEATPGVKPEELESRAIKRKLEVSPRITQEELQKTIATNKPPIPKRIMLGAGLDQDWKPKLDSREAVALENMGLEPMVSPDDGNMFGFVHRDTGEAMNLDVLKTLDADDFAVDPQTYSEALRAAKLAQIEFDQAIDSTKTKFSQVSKSKGQNNYREILLQHTGDDGLGNPAVVQRIDELLKKAPATEEEAAAINKELDELMDKTTVARRPYNSSHWEQPDILAHYRVSDMTGPNGEKVLYVDEIQSDWHQQARDARKREVKEQLKTERGSIHDRAVAQLEEEVGNLDINDVNTNRLKVIENALTRERKAQLEQEIPENAGYRTAEDNDKLNSTMDRIHQVRENGLTTQELQDYFQPGKIVPSYGGVDKVLSFNTGENNPKYKESYDEFYKRNMTIGVGEEAAARNARKNALNAVKNDWSVTVIEVDPKTGEPRRGAGPRTHVTSPEKEILQDLRKEADRLERKVPDAPFKKNWHELAVKDILDLATKEGYDKVAFSPGVEQVKRYESDVRRAVDSIKYMPGENGLTYIVGYKDGRQVFRADALGDTLTNGPGALEGKTLSEVFGSSIAKQIEEGVASPFINRDDEILATVGLKTVREGNSRMAVDAQGVPVHQANSSIIHPGSRLATAEESAAIDMARTAPVAKQIKGENLTVGGEGMKSFYDQRVPSFVKNYAGKEFKAPTSYMEIENPVSGKNPTRQQILDEGERIYAADDEEFMERLMERTNDEATRRVEADGLSEADDPELFDRRRWEIMEEVQDALHDDVLHDLASDRLYNQGAKGEKVKAFSVDVTPQMKEKITTEGQKLFAATPAIGLGTAQLPQQSAPAEEPVKEEQPLVSSEGPQAFQKGGKVGTMKDAAETLLRVFHGSPSRISLDSEKNLDVTTDPRYAVKRGRDKMDQSDKNLQGPPMVNKFDVPASKMLRFEETYTPEDVALMRRFFGKLPEGKAMTGEEIYEAADGKSYLMPGIAKAGGFAGYQRPAGGSGGIGDWYLVTDQNALTRKARGGMVQGYAGGGLKGGKVDLARRGILGLGRLFDTPAQTANLPAVIPASPLANVAPVVKAPDVASPLVQLAQKVAETPMSRRDVLKRAGNVAVSHMGRGLLPVAAKQVIGEVVKSAIPAIDEVAAANKIADYAAGIWGNSKAAKKAFNAAYGNKAADYYDDINDVPYAELWREIDLSEAGGDLKAAMAVGLDLNSVAAKTGLPLDVVKKIAGSDGSLINELSEISNKRVWLDSVLDDGRTKEARRSTSYLDLYDDDEFMNETSKKALKELGSDADELELLQYVDDEFQKKWREQERGFNLTDPAENTPLRRGLAKNVIDDDTLDNVWSQAAENDDDYQMGIFDYLKNNGWTPSEE